MFLERSLWRKFAVTAIAAVVFAGLYEVTIHDSKFATSELTSSGDLAPPAPGQRLLFAATAYCKGIVTTSGVAVQNGTAAADPTLLPIGTIFELDSQDGSFDGIYTVLDTGPSVQGRRIDLYMWNCNDALRFGRQTVHLRVLRLGWNPRAITPRFMDRLFKRAESSKPALPSRPLPLSP
jgi:3D (Asp-Asp-Asp) domain-containing protein